METRTRSKMKSLKATPIKVSQIGKANISRRNPVKKDERKTEQMTPCKGGTRKRKLNEAETSQEVEDLDSEKPNESPITRNKRSKITSTVEPPEEKTSAIEETSFVEDLASEKPNESPITRNKRSKITSTVEHPEEKTSAIEETSCVEDLASEKPNESPITRNKKSKVISTIEHPKEKTSAIEETSSLEDLASEKPNESPITCNKQSKILSIVEHAEAKTSAVEETENQTSCVKEIDNNYLTFEKTESQTSTVEEIEKQSMTVEENESGISTSNEETERKSFIVDESESQMSFVKKCEETQSETLNTEEIEKKTFVESECQAVADEGTKMNLSTDVEREFQTLLTEVENEFKTLPAVDSRCTTDTIEQEQPNNIQEKVLVGLKDAPPDFHLLTRLLGPQEQNIEFLKIQTKASVELLGEGSMNPSVEPLHFLVRHSNSEGLQEAVLLVQHLVDTVHQDFKKYCGEEQEKESSFNPLLMKTGEPGPPGTSPTSLPTGNAPDVDGLTLEEDEQKALSSYKTGEWDMEVEDEKDNEIIEDVMRSEKVYVGLESAPAEFGLLDKLLGLSDSNIEYLQTQTEAEVELRGSGSRNVDSAMEPLHFLVRHKTAEGLQKAVQLIRDLINTVHHHFQQCWSQMQVSTNYYPPVPVPPWPMMMYHQSSSMPMCAPTPPLSFTFTPPPQVMEFTSLLQRTMVTAVPLVEQQSLSRTNQDSYDTKPKAGSGEAEKEKLIQLQMVRRRVQEIQERWKSEQAAKESTETLAPKKTVSIHDLINDLKKEAKQQMSTMPPGFLRNQYLKICHLCNDILPTKDETRQHSQLSSLVAHLSKLFLNTNTQRLNNIKPVHLNLQKVLTDLSVKLNLPQQTIVEKRKQNVYQSPIRGKPVAKPKDNPSNSQKNKFNSPVNKSTITNRLSPLNKQQDIARLKPNQNLPSRFDHKPKSRSEVFNKSTKEKSKRLSSPNQRDSKERESKCPSGLNEKRDNFRRNSFGVPADEKQESHLTSSSPKDSTKHKQTVQSRFDDSCYGRRDDSVQKSTEEKCKPHSTLTNMRDSLGNKPIVQLQICDRQYKMEERLPEDSTAPKPKMVEKPLKQKKIPPLSAVVMQLHEEVSQFLETLPEGFQRAQLEQILTMLKETPFSLQLTEDQRTELKAISLLLRTTLRAQLQQGEPASLIEQVKWFDECLKFRTDLKPLSQDQNESLIVLNEDSKNIKEELKNNKKSNKLTSGQKRRLKKLLVAGVPKEEAIIQVKLLPSSNAQTSSETLKQNITSSESNTSNRANDESSHHHSERSQEHHQSNLDKHYPSEDTVDKYEDEYVDDIWMEYSPPPANFDKGNSNSAPHERSNHTNSPSDFYSNLLYENSLKEDPQFSHNERYDQNISLGETGGPSTLSYQQPRSISELTSSSRFGGKEVSTFDKDDSNLEENYEFREHHSDYYFSQKPQRERHDDKAWYHDPEEDLYDERASYDGLEEQFQEPHTDMSDDKRKYYDIPEDSQRQPKIQLRTSDSISRLTYDYKKGVNHERDYSEIYSNRNNDRDRKRQHEDNCGFDDFNRKTSKGSFSPAASRRFFPEGEFHHNEEQEETYSDRSNTFCPSSSNANIPYPEETSIDSQESYERDCFQNIYSAQGKNATDLFDVPSDQRNKLELQYKESEIRSEFKADKKKRSSIQDVPGKYGNSETFPWVKEHQGPVSRWDTTGSSDYHMPSNKINRLLGSFSFDETPQTSHTSTLYPCIERFESGIPNKRAKIDDPDQIKPINQQKRKKKKRPLEEVIVSIMDVDFPKVLLSFEQLKSIRLALCALKSSSDDKSKVPRFNTYSVKAGFLMAMCKDRTSAELTKAMVPKLKPWNEANLYAVDEDRMDGHTLILVFFPKSSHYPDEMILKLLATQNKDLNATEWTVVNRTDKPKCARLIILVDPGTIDKIKNGLTKVYYRFGQVNIKLYEPQRGHKFVKGKTQTSDFQNTQSKSYVKTDKDSHQLNLEDY